MLNKLWPTVIKFFGASDKPKQTKSGIVILKNDSCYKLIIITKKLHQHMSVNESHNPIYTKLNKKLKDLKYLRGCFPGVSVLKTTTLSENMDNAHP